MTRGRGLGLAVVAALALTSCAGSVGRESFDAEVQSRGGGIGSDLPLDALDALEEELGGDLAIRSMNLTASLASIQVRVPGTQGDLDNYNYGTSGLYGGGDLSGPTPVPSPGAGAPVEQTLFRPERVAFDRLDEMVDEALDQAGLEGGFAQNVFISRAPGGRPTITIAIANDRENVSITFSADGDQGPG